MESSPESFESEEDISISHSKSPFYKTLQTPCGVVEVYDLEPCVRGDVVFLFTPGNPGVIQLYERFLKSLFYKLDQKIRVVGVGHLGHSKNDLNDGKIFGVEEQLEKTKFIVQNLAEQHGANAKIVLAGHSFGSFINLNVIQRSPELPICFAFHLFPVICRLRVPSAMKFISRPFIRKYASRLISKLANYSTIGLATNFASYTQQEATLVINYSQNDRFIENVLVTGDEALQCICETLSPELLQTVQNIKDKSLFVCTPKDRYVTEDIVEYLLEVVQDQERFVFIPEKMNVDHAFVINKNYTVVRNILVKELLTNSLTKPFFEDL